MNTFETTFHVFISYLRVKVNFSPISMAIITHSLSVHFCHKLFVIFSFLFLFFFFFTYFSWQNRVSLKLTGSTGLHFTTEMIKDTFGLHEKNVFQNLDWLAALQDHDQDQASATNLLELDWVGKNRSLTRFTRKNFRLD